MRADNKVAQDLLQGLQGWALGDLGSPQVCFLPNPTRPALTPLLSSYLAGSFTISTILAVSIISLGPFASEAEEQRRFLHLMAE